MRERRRNLVYMGRGTPVVMLHSAMSSKLQWYQLMRVLSGDYMSLAVDLYGYGEAPFPDKKEDFSLLDEVNRLESELAGFIAPDQPFHLVGHSYGGAVALRLAYKRPKRVLSLSLFEPVPFHLLPEGEEALAVARRVGDEVHGRADRGDFMGAAGFFIDYYSGPGTFSNMPREVREILGESIKMLAVDFNALLREPLKMEDYKDMGIPLCLMVGNDSPLDACRVGEFMAEQIPDALLHRVEGGHMAPVQRHQSVNPLIAEFIRKVGRGQK